MRARPCTRDKHACCADVDSKQLGPWRLACSRGFPKKSTCHSYITAVTAVTQQRKVVMCTAGRRPACVETMHKLRMVLQWPCTCSSCRPLGRTQKLYKSTVSKLSGSTKCPSKPLCGLHISNHSLILQFQTAAVIFSLLLRLCLNACFFTTAS